MCVQPVCHKSQKKKLYDRSYDRCYFNQNQAYNEDPVGFYAQREDVISWTSKITNWVRTGQPDAAFGFFKMMFANGHRPNHVTMLSVIRAFDALSWESMIEVMHGGVIKLGFESEVAVSTALLWFYSMRDVGIVWKLFYQIPYKDVVFWSATISACVKNGQCSEALDLFREMQYQGVQPNHLEVGTDLLQLYAKFGDLELAKLIFDELVGKDFIAWSAMIAAYSHGEDPLNAIQTFKTMQSTNEKPNETTFVSLMNACSSLGAQELGESIQAHTTKCGYSSNSHLMFDFYCTLGRIKLGEHVFYEILTKDLICWGAMIKGYGMNGCGSEALHTFSDMLSYGLKPNAVLFVSLLSACAQCGLEKEGWIWFHSMIDKYAITPMVAHYACIVDLLVRQGKIREAVEFVKKMPVEPDTKIWDALFSGCKLID